MSPILKYKIKGPWSGELAIAPRPRGDDWLEDEIRRWRDDGVEIVVSLLTAAEIEELGLINERKALEAVGLQYCNYPIPDLGIPASNKSAKELLIKIHDALQGSKKVALHCRGSIGRSGLIAAGVLVLAGVEPSRAIRDVTKARGFDSPETAEQKEWVRALSAQLADLAA